jgi:hypothetical protein
LEPPYVVGLERPTLDGDSGELTQKGRELIEHYGWDGIGRNPNGGKARL